MTTANAAARQEHPYSAHMRIRALILAPLIAAVAIVGLAPASTAAAGKTEIVRVYHEAVQPTSIQGSGVGAIRTFFIPMAVNGSAADNQYLSGTLTTLVEGMPNGQELRASNLVFVFGDEANQLVVGGVSLYAPAGATLAPGQRTIRPVLGGSGTYEGATGQVVSTNLGANGWTHIFRISTD